MSRIERRSTAPDEKTRGVALSAPALRSRADAGPRSQGAAGRVGREEVSDAAPLAPPRAREEAPLCNELISRGGDRGGSSEVSCPNTSWNQNAERDMTCQKSHVIQR